jgi:hypothetical protein
MKKLILSTSAVAMIAIGCQMASNKYDSRYSNLAEFGEATDCGSVFTIGEQTAGQDIEGRLSRMPANINVMAQIIACGGQEGEANRWHAIGAGIERDAVVLSVGGKQIPAKLEVASSGEVSAVSSEGRSVIGNVPEKQAAMPINFASGVKAQVRVGDQVIDLKNAKNYDEQQMAIWILR